MKPASDSEHVISFVIPVLNGAATIRECLNSILAQMTHRDEIIVVDNGSTDGTLELLQGLPEVKVLTYPDISVAALRNRGAAVAKGNLLAFIDSDVVLAENWRTNLVAVLENQRVGATGSVCGLPDEPSWVEAAWYSQRSGKESPVSYINSGNLIIRREMFDRVSGFDERLITDEDCDIGRRLNKLECLVWEAPRVRTIHLGNPKTILAFFHQQKWRATSSLATQVDGAIDKPTIMTGLFLLGAFASLASIPLALVWGREVLLAWLAIPALLLVTALYRMVEYRNPRYFLELQILHFFFYLARSTVMLKAAFRGTHR